jgi:Domain of unknown function (DUF4010)
MPPSGLYAVAALSGLVDVDAITLSMAELAKTGEVRVAVIAIVIAALSNTLVKCGLAAVLAGMSLGKPLLIATATTHSQVSPPPSCFEGRSPPDRPSELGANRLPPPISQLTPSRFFSSCHGPDVR